MLRMRWVGHVRWGASCVLPLSPCPLPVSSRRRATSSVNSRLLRLTRLYMMIAQKFTAPQRARTLRDICSDSRACRPRMCR